MAWLFAKSRTGKFVEGSLHLLDGIISWGLVSGAVVAAAFGKLFLGGVLAAVALGVFLRFTRRAKSKAASAQKSTM
jgi:hypothetical protein